MRLASQVYMPHSPLAVMNTLKLIDRLVSSVDLVLIHCTPERRAAEVAYAAIFEGAAVENDG